MQAGCAVVPSQASFVYARSPRADWLRDGLAGLGIGVRTFADQPGALRLAVPPVGVERVCQALAAVAAPEAVIFDMDGVLADVGQSYRAAIVQTAAHFGVHVDSDDIHAAKARGNANNDWVLTRDLLAARGVQASLPDVTEQFEARYQGSAARPGLWTTETLRCTGAWLAGLAQRLPLAIVTGRPRKDARRFLDHFDIAGHFQAVICMEDAPAKPDPAPVRLALQQLGVGRAWMVGDTPDDLRAARAAGVVPLGICPPGEQVEASLFAAGAARVLASLPQLEDLLR